jgi:hypothetical protein
MSDQAELPACIPLSRSVLFSSSDVTGFLRPSGLYSSPCVGVVFVCVTYFLL